MSMFSFAESHDGDNPYDLTKYVDRVSIISQSNGRELIVGANHGSNPFITRTRPAAICQAWR